MSDGSDNRRGPGPLSGRHRHVEDVRSDGLAVVLGPVLRNGRVTAVTLADVQSGMVLDAHATGDPGDLEMLGARHAELFRVGLDVLRGPDGAVPDEMVVSPHRRCHHVLRGVPDPPGGHLVLSAVVHGSWWHLLRVRRLLRRVPVAALTAGPTLRRRPDAGGWGRSGWTDTAGPVRFPGPPGGPRVPDAPRVDAPGTLPVAGGRSRPAWPAAPPAERPPSPPSAMPSAG